MQIDKINTINFDVIYSVLSSGAISNEEKRNFISTNRAEIKHVMNNVINEIDFKFLMDNRTLKKFHPLRNSYTKWGDKIILAKALNISTAQVPRYIKSIKDSIEALSNTDFLPASKAEMIKTYVYRHGSKDELVAFLDYELKKAKDIQKCLYNTLTYYTGGVADYFIRPIHRMDNKTLLKLFHVITKNIESAQKNGSISQEYSNKLAKTALVRIYEIQNNSKLINAIKTRDILK